MTTNYSIPSKREPSGYSAEILEYIDPIHKDVSIFIVCIIDGYEKTNK